MVKLKRSGRKHKSKSQSQFRRLPQELRNEIFFHLPVKSLAKFQLVCKKWRSLIKDANFQKAHLEFSIKNSSSSSSALLLFCGGRKNDMLPLSIEHKDISGCAIGVEEGKLIPGSRSYELLRPLGSCRGLVCFIDSFINVIDVVNPTTKQRDTLLSPVMVENENRFNCFVYGSGFGFVPSIDDYKVVVLLAQYEGFEVAKRQVFVRSLRDDCWRELDGTSLEKALGQHSRPYPHMPQEDGAAIDLDIALTPLLDASQSVMFNEALYWIVVPSDSSSDCFLLKFDLVEEVFERVSNLKQINRGHPRQAYSYFKTSIGVTGQNNLCVCLLYCKSNASYVLEMWSLEQHGERNSWRPKRLFETKLDSEFVGSSPKLLGFMSNYNALIKAEVEGQDQLVLVDPSRHPPAYFVVAAKKSISDVASYIPSLIKWRKTRNRWVAKMLPKY